MTPDIDLDLHHIIEQVEQLAPHDITAEAAPTDLARRLSMVGAIKAIAAKWGAELEVALTDAMPEDRMRVEGLGTIIREPRPAKATWQREEVRRDIRKAVLDDVSLDLTTGEHRGDWRGVAARTFDAVTQTYSCLDPLVGGLKAFKIDPNYYRSFEPQGYKVKLVPSDAE